MKKGLLKMCICTILAMVLAVCYSCKNKGALWETEDCTDSVFVADYIEEVINPQFVSTEEINLFQDRLLEEYNVDKEFRDMSKATLFNVATVCLKNSVFVTKADIVKEYRANRSVYDALDNKTPKDTIPVTQADSPPEPNQIEYRFETDTVDGKPIKVKIKTEKTYESQ